MDEVQKRLLASQTCVCFNWFLWDTAAPCLCHGRARIEFTCVDLALTAWSIATMRMDPPGRYDAYDSHMTP